MPHLSPIMWTAVYAMIWTLMMTSTVYIEQTNTKLYY